MAFGSRLTKAYWSLAGLGAVYFGFLACLLHVDVQRTCVGGAALPSTVTGLKLMPKQGAVCSQVQSIVVAKPRQIRAMGLHEYAFTFTTRYFTARCLMYMGFRRSDPAILHQNGRSRESICLVDSANRCLCETSKSPACRAYWYLQRRTNDRCIPIATRGP